ncbi:hypothetical protein GINT2_000834 [Glugoides intestinalis]
MKIICGLSKEKVEKNSMKLELQGEDFIYYDISKSEATEQDKEKIKERILDNDLNLKLDGMWYGKNVNYTESRPVLHYLLRDKDILDKVEAELKGEMNIAETDSKNTKDVINMAKQEIFEELMKIANFTESFEGMKGITGKKLDTIINIGIGGSDLGPRMVTEALQYYAKKRNVYFISNVDPSDTLKTFSKIDVEKTLFIVVSKTFTTIETIQNFKLALGLTKSMLDNKFTEEEICSKQFVAISSNTHETAKYGIGTVLKMWDFVGGRYSLWSAVGLSISLYIGFENYLKLLRGASTADQDFYLNRVDSISGKLAINELFYISKGYNNKCLVCYDSYLGLFYKYLQQAEMESNGKHDSKQMILWGGVGTDVQHSFFQLLHQGEQEVYLEFVCPISNINTEASEKAILENLDAIKYQQKLLAVSCLAQSRSMLIGKQSNDVNHLFPGNKPSVTILYSKLTPEALGAMLAIYEHKIFITGIYFNINSFDQFGVELGKALTKELMKDLNGEPVGSLDASTNSLMDFIRKN